MSEPQITREGMLMYIQGARGVLLSATMDHLFKDQEVAIGYLLAMDHMLDVIEGYPEIVGELKDAPEQFVGEVY